MKVDYKKDGKSLKRIVTTTIAMGSLKGKITRVKNDMEHAKQQVKIWADIVLKKEKELAQLQEILNL